MAKQNKPKVDILIVEHKVSLYSGDAYLTELYIKDDNEWCLCNLYKDYEFEHLTINEAIAESLVKWFGNMYNYQINEEIIPIDCEYCGYYENREIVIYFNNYKEFKDGKLVDIEMYEDNHLGQSSGLSDDDVVDMWKKNNIYIEFKYIY